MKVRLYSKTYQGLLLEFYQKNTDGWVQISEPKKVYRWKYAGSCYMMKMKKIDNEEKV